MDGTGSRKTTGIYQAINGTEQLATRIIVNRSTAQFKFLQTVHLAPRSATASSTSASPRRAARRMESSGICKSTETFFNANLCKATFLGGQMYGLKKFELSSTTVNYDAGSQLLSAINSLIVG